jgi:hypothetical protein
MTYYMKSLRGSTDWFRMEGLRLKKMNMKRILKKKHYFWNNAFTYPENTSKIWLAMANELCSHIEAKTVRKVQHQEWETKSNASNYSCSDSLIHWGFTFMIIYCCNSFLRTKRSYSPDTTNCISGHLTCVFIHHLFNQQFIISNLTSVQIVKNSYLEYNCTF